MKRSWRAGRDKDKTCFHGKYWFVLGLMPKYNSYFLVLILVLLFCFGFRTALALPWYKADAVITFLCCLAGSHVINYKYLIKKGKNKSKRQVIIFWRFLFLQFFRKRALVTMCVFMLYSLKLFLCRISWRTTFINDLHDSVCTLW